MVEGRVPRQVVVVGRRGARRERVSVPEELAVRVRLNGRTVARLAASPLALDELALGHLALAGLVRSRADVRGVEVLRLVEGARVEVRASARAPVLPRPLPRARFLAAARVPALMRALVEGAALYREGGGVHTSALAGPRGLRFLAADLGKVHTLDRLAGQALLAGAPTRGLVLLTTGRLTGAMVAKGLALGCPVMVSHSGPTSEALARAEAAGATLVGYARGASFAVYADHGRLRLPGARRGAKS